MYLHTKNKHILENEKKKKKKTLQKLPFQNGGQMTSFRFTSFQFLQKFVKPLSQRNFSMKFGSL